MRLTNLTKSPPDSRDYQYSGVTQGLPSSVDLRQYVPDIEDQAVIVIGALLLAVAVYFFTH